MNQSVNFFIAQNKEIIQRGTGRDGEARLAVYVLETVSNFNHVNVATALHRLAKLGARGAGSGLRNGTKDAVRALEQRALQLLEDFVPQGVVNLLWSYGTMGLVPRADVLTALQDRCVIL